MSEDRHSAGIETFKKLFGPALLEAGPLDSFSTIAIDILFGEIYPRGGFALRDRSLVTVAALVALGRLEELELHIFGALNLGISQDELREMMIHLSFYAGFPAGRNATLALDRVLEKRT